MGGQPCLREPASYQDRAYTLPLAVEVRGVVVDGQRYRVRVLSAKAGLISSSQPAFSSVKGLSSEGTAKSKQNTFSRWKAKDNSCHLQPVCSHPSCVQSESCSSRFRRWERSLTLQETVQGVSSKVYFLRMPSTVSDFTACW